MKHLTEITLLLICFAFSISAQTETLTNGTVIEMSKAGLDKAVIFKKINDSNVNFDVSTSALIALKKEGVADEVIALMLEKKQGAPEVIKSNEPSTPDYSETVSTLEIKQFAPLTFDVKEALLNAKTVAIEKSSLNPSRQGLEKALFKRKDWQKYKLTLIRYKQDADLYIEIGRVPFSWLSHRYVFRLYDRRSGTIITAGETTSWGSLAENLAREITQKMNLVAGN